ncbi:MAG TPA: hypothetical protein VIK26_09705 [Clostridium sp.]
MKINQKALTILVVLSSIITICLVVLHFVTDDANIDIVIIFVGLNQLFGGLSQINMAHEMNSKGIIKGNKVVGVFTFILGIVIITIGIVKIIVY